MEIMKILSWTQTSNWGNYFKTNSPEIFVMYLFFISSFSTKMPCDATLLNESKSIESLKKNEHQTEFNESTLIKYKSEAVSGWECNCWNTTSEFKLELECRCAGESLLRIPQKLFPSMQRLTIASAGLTMIRSAGFKIYSSSLRDLVLSDLHHFEYIQERAFEPLNLLRTIYISYAPKLTYISKDIFKGLSDTIKTIKIVHSGLVRIPDMRYLPLNAILQIIDLGSNKIESIYSYSIKIKTEQLILDNNMLTNIEDSAFFGSQIAKLSIAGNRLLERINPTAFNGIMNIQELDLSNTSLSVLPSYGLGDLEILRVQNTHTLKTIPSIYYFQNLQVAWLTHSFHCCAFQFPSRHDPLRHTQNLLDMEKRQKTCATKLQQQLKQRPSDFEKQKNRDYFFKETNILNGTVSLITSIDYVPNQHEIQEIDDEDVTEVDFGEFHETADISPGLQQDAFCGNLSIKKSDVSCFPVPDALNPCEDVMGSDWLRISVWIVVSLAVIGNVAVLVVILFTRSDNHSVQKLLICHLAFADLCLGLYLFLIAFMDSHSMGEYFNYAYDWQYGAGCKVAGFLTVFASHLSVYALTIITIERWLAITYALYLNKRITVRAATYIMMVGWVYSILMSSFPLFGISNYSSTSICLPMETRNASDVIYLVSIIGVNGVAFFIIAVCYAQIYFSLGHETRHLRSLTEMSVAKKMALLVCTNFSCWAPIAFFGLTALAGYPLIDVTKSKILLVFFYPMNSCADPYLYAILTSQYRKDLYTFLSRFGLCKATAFRHRKHFTSHVTNGSYQITTFQGHNSFISSRTTQGFEMMIQADEFV